MYLQVTIPKYLQKEREDKFKDVGTLCIDIQLSRKNLQGTVQDYSLVWKNNLIVKRCFQYERKENISRILISLEQIYLLMWTLSFSL